MSRTSYGTVSSAGEKTGGTDDWTVRPDGNGLFLIVFEPSYNVTPNAVVTQIFPNNLSSPGGNTKDNSVIVGIDANELKIITGNSDGVPNSRRFSFIAMGE